MWAHYADSHRGFVIGFDSNSDFFNPDNGKAIDGLRPVTYSGERAEFPESGLTSADSAQLHSANEQLFFTKNSDWAYEQEMRILGQPSAADTTIPVDDSYDICLFKFPPESCITCNSI